MSPVECGERAGACRQSWTGCRRPGVECYAGTASKHPEASDEKVTSQNHRGGAPSHHLVKPKRWRHREVPLHPSFIPEAKSWRTGILLRWNRHSRA